MLFFLTDGVEKTIFMSENWSYFIFVLNFVLI